MKNLSGKMAVGNIQRIKKLNYERKVRYCLDDDDFCGILVEAWGKRLNQSWTMVDVYEFHEAVTSSNLSVSKFLQEIRNV